MATLTYPDTGSPYQIHTDYTYGFPFGAVCPLGSAVVGVAYSQTGAVSGGTPPYTFSAVGLPDGLTIDPGPRTNILITGTPTTANSYSYTITITDADDNVIEKDCLIVVIAPSRPARFCVGQA